jgi:hypothetical protein
VSGAVLSDETHIVVQLWPLALRPDGTLLPLQKRSILAGSGQQPAATTRAQGGAFAFSAVAPGNYSVLAFSDVAGDGQLQSGAPLGFAATASCYGRDEGSNVCVDVLQVTGANVVAPPVELRAPTRFTPAPNRSGAGAFDVLRGVGVLRLGPGTPHERGWAHGSLVGQQVMDVLEFFLLEDRVRDMHAYETVVRPRLQAQRLFATPREAIDEARGIVEGVAAAGVSLRLRALRRDADEWDVLALNAYGELTVLGGMPGFARGGACSQLLLWGERTAGSDVDGGTVAGRNMDGEIDVRKVTVSHLLVIATDAGDGSRRFVSVFWPGFFGVYSGFNEAGISMMVNAATALHSIA